LQKIVGCICSSYEWFYLAHDPSGRSRRPSAVVGSDTAGDHRGGGHES